MFHSYVIESLNNILNWTLKITWNENRYFDGKGKVILKSGSEAQQKKGGFSLMSVN